MAIENELRRTPTPTKARRSPGRSPARRWLATTRRFLSRRRSSVRARVLRAFVDIGKAVDARTAYVRTKDFYRASGQDWTKHLG